MSMKRELPQVGGFARQLPVTQNSSQRPARKVEGGPRDSAEGDQVTVETTDRVYWTYCQRKWPSNSPEYSADRRSPSFPNTNQLRGRFASEGAHTLGNTPNLHKIWRTSLPGTPLAPPHRRRGAEGYTILARQPAFESSAKSARTDQLHADHRYGPHESSPALARSKTST